MTKLEQAEAARQAWAIRAAEESARADALLDAAEPVILAIDTWNETVQQIMGRQPNYAWGGLEALRSAVEAAKVKHGE